VIYFSHQQRPPNSLLALNGWNMPFVNNVKYPGIIFHKRMTWRLHIETIEAKALRIFLRLYCLFKSERRLSSHIKLTLHRALITSVMIYSCPTWEFEAENHLLKLQCLQNRVLHTIGNFPRHTSVCNMHVASQIPYVYDYIKNNAGSKHKPSKIMKIFATLERRSPAQKI
jgi:hypothetical protein